MEEQLLNVHEVLSESAHDIEDTAAMTTASFRIHADEKKLAAQICEQNNSDLSKFLRSCCKRLIADYVETPDVQEAI